MYYLTWVFIMGASYNFYEDNSNMKFVKRIQQTKSSLIVLMITTGVLIVSSILQIFVGHGNDAIILVNVILEIALLLINIPALILLLLGIDDLRDKIDSTKKSPLRYAVIFLGVYFIYYFISTIIMLIFTLANINEGEEYLISKNLMCYIFIAIALVFISLAFNKMSNQGYPTKLLLTPPITLPLVASVSFFIGWFTIFIGFRFYYGVIPLLAIIFAIYLPLALLISFLEFYVSFNKMHNDVLLNLAPELLQKKENQKEKTKVEKVVDEGKAVV